MVPPSPPQHPQKGQSRRGRSPTRRDAFPSRLTKSVGENSFADNHGDSFDDESSRMNANTFNTSSESTSATILSRDRPSSWLAPSSHGKILIFIPCILLLSLLVTSSILYMVGYDVEMYLLYQECKEYCLTSFSSLLQPATTTSISSTTGMLKRGVRSLSYSSLTSFFLKDDNDVTFQNYTTYTIFDKSVDVSTSNRQISNDCREKDALYKYYNNTNMEEEGATTTTTTKTKTKTTKKHCRSILTSDMIETFHKDGVIAIRGLLSEELYHNLNQSSLQLVDGQLKKVGFRTSTGTKKTIYVYIISFHIQL